MQNLFLSLSHMENKALFNDKGEINLSISIWVYVKSWIEH